MPETDNNLIRLRAGTRPKLQAIADTNRWNLNVAIDAAVDEYIARHKVKVPKQQRRRR